MTREVTSPDLVTWSADRRRIVIRHDGFLLTVWIRNIEGEETPHVRGLKIGVRLPDCEIPPAVKSYARRRAMAIFRGFQERQQARKKQISLPFGS